MLTPKSKLRFRVMEFGETLMQRLEPAQEICEEPNGEVFITEIVDKPSGW